MTKRIYKKDDDNDDTNKNRTSRNKTGAQGNNERNNKRKVIVTGNSLLDGISGRGLSKDQQVLETHYLMGLVDVDYPKTNRYKYITSQALQVKLF